MTPREELEMLRARKARLAELEAKAAGVPMAAPPPAAAPAEEASFLGDVAQGAKSYADRAALGLKGLLPQALQSLGDRADAVFGSGGLTPETAVQTPDSAGGMVGSIGGEVATMLVPGAAALKAASLTNKALKATRFAKAALPAALAMDLGLNAAASAATTPEDRGTAALIGAGGSLVGSAAGRVLGGAARKSVSPQAQQLLDAGITLTPGQAVSGPQAGPIARMLRAFEDKASSVPFLGDAVTNAQQRAGRQFNETMLNRAMGSLGKVDEAGVEGLAKADQLISDAYTRVLPDISIDSQGIGQAISDSRTTAMTNPLFDDVHANTFEKFIARRIAPLLESGSVDGQTAKAIDAELGELSRDFLNAGPGNKPLGQAFAGLRDSWRGNLQGATPEARQALKDADQAYAKLLPLSEAGDRTASGMFSPMQLANQLRRLNMEPDELVQAARQVMPNTVPDSGTAGRAVVAKLLTPTAVGAGTVAGAGVMGFAPAAAAGLGTMALYTKPGIRGLTQGVHPLVKRLRGGANYDYESVEDIIRNLSGRASSSAVSE